MATDGKPPVIEGEPVADGDRAALTARLAHLQEHRPLIIRRALLATAVGGALPIPVLDEYFAVRVRAGMFMKLAQQRHVDLPASAAELLAEGKEGSAVRNATLTAASLIAIKLAWKKFFALLAAGRGAEEAAVSYQSGLLFDHYCARLHVGPAIDRELAARLRRAIHGTVASTGKDTLAQAFREGGRILGRSLLQAPGWFGGRMTELFTRFVQTGGNAEASAAVAAARDADADGEAKFLDKAAQTVETRLAALGQDYLSVLVARFETAWAASRPEPQPPTPAPAPSEAGN